MAAGWTQFQPWKNQPLPPGWEARYDANVKRYYFIDHTTHKTTWEDPRVRKPEAIPMSQFKASSAGRGSNQLETSFGGSSSRPGPSAAPKTTPAEPARPASFTDDDFPLASESFLAEIFKEKSDDDKENVKRKLIREFPGVDEVVIEVALRTAKHDEVKARDIVKKLKGDDDHKKEPAKTKKQEPAKAKSASQEGLDKTKAKKTSVPAKAKSTSQEALDQAKAKKTSVPAKGLDQAKPKTTAAAPKPVKSPEPAAPSTSLAALIGDSSTGGGSMSVSDLTSRSGKKVAVPQRQHSPQKKIYAGTGKAYKSPLLSAPHGPNPANAQGPNPLLLLPEWVQPEGPQRQNRRGPVRSNRQGPAKRTLGCGPQASNRTGPVPNMAMGSIYAKSALYTYV